MITKDEPAPKDFTDYPPLVCIEWEDAMNIATWQDLSEAVEWATGPGFLCRNVGYLIHEDDQCVVLAARFNIGIDDIQCGLFERLPKGMIVRRWTLDAGSPRAVTGANANGGTPA